MGENVSFNICEIFSFPDLKLDSGVCKNLPAEFINTFYGYVKLAIIGFVSFNFNSDG